MTIKEELTKLRNEALRVREMKNMESKEYTEEFFEIIKFRLRRAYEVCNAQNYIETGYSHEGNIQDPFKDKLDMNYLKELCEKEGIDVSQRHSVHFFSIDFNKENDKKDIKDHVREIFDGSIAELYDDYEIVSKADSLLNDKIKNNDERLNHLTEIVNNRPEHINAVSYAVSSDIDEEYLQSLEEEAKTPLRKYDKEAYRYVEFLEDVKEATEKFAFKCLLQNQDEQTWDITGIELLSSTIDKMYGEDVYLKANAEVPFIKVDEERQYLGVKRDFENADIKLAHLIVYDFSASPVIDLDLFIQILNTHDVSSHIDYENNKFHFNTKRIIMNDEFSPTFK